MTAAARKPDPIDVFKLRCEARAMLVDLNFLSLHEAVDELWADAVRVGLVDLIGKDAVQEIMATAIIMGGRS